VTYPRKFLFWWWSPRGLAGATGEAERPREGRRAGAGLAACVVVDSASSNGETCCYGRGGGGGFGVEGELAMGAVAVADGEFWVGTGKQVRARGAGGSIWLGSGWLALAGAGRRWRWWWRSGSHGRCCPGGCGGDSRSLSVSVTSHALLPCGDAGAKFWLISDSRHGTA